MNKEPIKRTLLDNSSEALSMVHAINRCMEEEGINYIRIATGYWDLIGTALVAENLAKFLSVEGNKMQLLLGKDPYVYAQQLERMPKGPLKPKFPDDFIRKDISELEFTPENLAVVRLLQQYCDGDDPRLEIRLYNQKVTKEMVNADGEKKEKEETQTLHSKCYIFNGRYASGTKWAYGIVGSSNFTGRGIKYPDGNAELNCIEPEAQYIEFNDKEDPSKKGHIQWFNERWEHSKPWNQEFLLKVLNKTPIGQEAAKPLPPPQPEPLTPYELYIKYLHMQFGDIADATTRAQLVSYLPEKFDDISYQMVAVEQCFNIMQRYGGFFLSDVVGLGKTVVGLLVIKKFLVEASRFNREPKVLIIVPPAIKAEWLDKIEKFDKDKEFKIRPHIDIITSGSVKAIAGDEEEEEDGDEFEEDFKPENYGMIIIDESHNFRNNETQKYKAVESLIDQITMQGEQPFVGLLSATPQNNSPEDLKNQIYLFELEPNRSKFEDIEGGKLDSFFADKERTFKALRNDNSDEARAKLKALSEEIRSKILDHIVVRRTRTDIKKHFEADAAKLNIPSLKGPNKLEYEMDPELAQLFYDTMNAILPDSNGGPNDGTHIGYYRYQAINFFCDPNNKKLYENRNLTVESITRRLSKIMQILLVKRLESSFAAFKESLGNLLQYTRNIIRMIEQQQVFVCPDINVNEFFTKYNYDFDAVATALRKEIERKGGNNICFSDKDFTDEYLTLLRQDEKLIASLYARWKANDYDPKLDAFKDALKNRLFDPAINNPSKLDKPRLVIFTEAKATQREIVRYAQALKHKVLCINAGNRKDKRDEIKENFDANSEIKKDDYDIIVTTEVLAEGVNLHRANVILNYDAPWNATRLMQRIGRVNRIGSKEKFIHVFNFYPSVQGNAYIRLVQKAYAKLQAFHTMFGEDSKVYSELEELSEKEFNHNFDGEESPFMPYMSELKQYRTDHPERYQVIKEAKLEHLGGQLTGGDGRHLFVIKAERHAGLPVILDSEGNGRVVSSLEFMEALKAASQYTFTTQADEAMQTALSKLSERAIGTFNMHVTHTISAKDMNKRIKEALLLLKQINEQLSSPEARRSLIAAKQAVNSGNTHVIKLVHRCAEEYLSRQTVMNFDVAEQDNIDLYVSKMFSHIAEKAKVKYSNPFVGMYETGTIV